jgi:hypothetical protein
MWITSEFVERVSTQSVAWPFIHAGILSFSYHCALLRFVLFGCFFKAGVLWCRNNGLPSILVVGTVSSQ